MSPAKNDRSWWDLLALPDGGSRKDVAELVAPSRPYDNYRKMICEKCRIPHVLVIRNTSKKLPDAIYCKVCRHILQPNAYERRRKERHEVDVLVTYTINGKNERQAKAVDLSPIGLRMICGEKIGPADGVEIEAPLFMARGKTAWMRKMGRGKPPLYEIGIRFDSFHPRNTKNAVLDVEV